MPQPTLSPKVFRIALGVCFMLTLFILNDKAFFSEYVHDRLVIVGMVTITGMGFYAWKSRIPFDEVFPFSSNRGSSKSAGLWFLAVILLPLIVGMVSFWVLMP
jgi:hypothetical protein